MKYGLDEIGRWMSGLSDNSRYRQTYHKSSKDVSSDDKER